MKGSEKATDLEGKAGRIIIKRNEHGIPVISASSFDDALFGQGWVNAMDRQVQAILMRVILQGRTAEVLAGTEELIAVDRYMRRLNLMPDSETEVLRLKPHIRERLEAYCKGFNSYISSNGVPWELKLLGYRHEPWTIKDCMVMAKSLGFFGQMDSIGLTKKLIIEMVQNKIPEKKIRELFPGIKGKIDYDLMGKIRLEDSTVPMQIKWLNLVPSFTASNNWVISGKRSETSGALFCNDPHLEANRLPAIWAESVMRIPDNYFAGANVPGIPGLIIGRNSDAAWGTTFSYMDMIDFSIEHCRDGKYRRGNKWLPFKVREEIIRVKKKEPVVLRCYENDEGILEGEPGEEGYYLLMKWAAQKGCGSESFNGSLAIDSVKNVKSLMKIFRSFDIAPINWVMADREGNIGYQMSGRLFKRAAGSETLLPLPAWEESNKSRGYADSSLYPSSYNPPEGFIVTANNDLNHLGKCHAISLCWASYRADRAADLIKSIKKCSIADMKMIQLDKYSIQAEKFMKIIRPHLPDSEKGDILKNWDFSYTGDSVGAALFESVYRSLKYIVFGDNGMGRDVMKHLLEETPVVTDFHGNFDAVLLKKKSAWFNGKSADEIIRMGVEEGLASDAVPYGKINRINMSHILFGGKLPRFMGFDYGPVVLEGSRATLNQGQIFRSAGRTSTFCPSYRIITDMTTDELHTNLPGGPSERRFSKLYTSDINNWIAGIYKVISPAKEV